MKEGAGGGKGRKRLQTNPSILKTAFAIFRVVFDSCSSFFATKPHRNACYAGYPSRGIFLRRREGLIERGA